MQPANLIVAFVCLILLVVCYRAAWQQPDKDD